MQVLKGLLSNQRGMVLVISLLILALLLAAGVGAIISVQTDLRTSSNFERGTQAFYIAEAGVHHARQEMQDDDGTADFNSIYYGSDGTEILPSTSLGEGTYRVTRVSQQTNRIKVLSAGQLPKNVKSEIEAWLRRDARIPEKTIVTGKDLEIPGNPKISGTCGRAHANDDAKIGGNPTIETANGLTAKDDIDIDGSPTIGGTTLNTSPLRNGYEQANDDAQPYSIPQINAADYAPYVAALGEASKGYILNNNGTVSVGGNCDVTSGLCSEETTVAAPAGWSFSDGKWRVSTGSAADGVFYAETKVEISGSPGNASAPWQATIISRDDIKISGNPHLQPYPTNSEELKNHLFVAGNDLEITGNMKADYTASAILVKDEFKVDANPKINGFVMARGKTTLKQNMEITFNCNLGCLGPGCLPPTVTTLSSTEKF